MVFNRIDNEQDVVNAVNAFQMRGRGTCVLWLSICISIHPTHSLNTIKGILLVIYGMVWGRNNKIYKY